MFGHYTFGPDKEDGDPGKILVENLFPPVMTEAEMDQILALNRKMTQLYGKGGPRRAANSTYVLSGVFRCATCGSSMRSRTSYPKDGVLRTSYDCRAAPEDNIPHPDGNNISCDMAEDAVMRVIQLAARDYLEQFQTAPAKSREPNNGSSLDKRIQNLTGRISRLVEGFDEGIMKREDFKPRYDALVKEREKLRESLQEKDSTSAIRTAMKQALASADAPKLTTEQARRLVLAFVEKVEGPVCIDHKRAALPKAKRCRAIWVTIRLPLLDGTTKVIAPMYDVQFKGERLLLDQE